MVALAPACATAPPANPGPTTDAAPAQRSACSVREGQDGVIFGCMAEHAILIAPGIGWRIDAATAPVFLLASRGYFHISMLTAGDASPEGVEARLRARYALARAPENTRVGPMRLAQTSSGRPVLYYEIEGLVADGRAVRSLHVWSALKRPDGRYVEYHSSWTGPGDDPELGTSGGRAALDVRLVNYADAFVTVDDTGHAVPQSP